MKLPSPKLGDIYFKEPKCTQCLERPGMWHCTRCVPGHWEFCECVELDWGEPTPENVETSSE